MDPRSAMTPLRKVGRALPGVFAVMILSAISWQWGFGPLFSTIGNWVQARDYVPVPATVELRTHQGRGERLTYYVLSYVRDGRDYETTRMSVLDDTDPFADSNQSVFGEISRAGQKWTVWVSPRRPDIVVASRDLPIESLLLPFVVAMVFAFFTSQALMNLGRTFKGVPVSRWHRLTGLVAAGGAFVMLIDWFVRKAGIDLAMHDIVGLTVFGAFAAVFLAMGAQTAWQAVRSVFRRGK